MSPPRFETVLGIEHSLGRVREEVWGPRIIDIDILLYEDLELELDDLSILIKRCICAALYWNLLQKLHRL